MVSQPSIGAPRSHRDLVCPLPPTCGVLGVALTWYVPDPEAGAEAAREVLRRQLAIWGVGRSAAAEASDFVLDELLASCVRHRCGPVFVEVCGSESGIALAVRPAGPSEWALPEGLGQRGLEAAQDAAELLVARPVPGGSGYAYVAVVPLQPTAQAENHAAEPAEQLTGRPGGAPHTASLPDDARRRRIRGRGRSGPRGPSSAATAPEHIGRSHGTSADRRPAVRRQTDGRPCHRIRVNAELGGPRGPTDLRRHPRAAGTCQSAPPKLIRPPATVSSTRCPVTGTMQPYVALHAA
jgi:hypothetical protein